jgi:hypothetical protein
MLLVANTINIAADIGAMGAALQLVVGGGAHFHALVFGIGTCCCRSSCRTGGSRRS